jgi:hypothetical protein
MQSILPELAAGSGVVGLPGNGRADLVQQVDDVDA